MIATRFDGWSEAALPDDALSGATEADVEAETEARSEAVEARDEVSEVRASEVRASEVTRMEDVIVEAGDWAVGGGDVVGTIEDATEDVDCEAVARVARVAEVWVEEAEASEELSDVDLVDERVVPELDNAS